MFDDLTEYSIRADHQNLLNDSRHVLGYEVPGRRKRLRMLRLIRVVRRHRLLRAERSVPAPTKPSSDIVAG